MDDGGGPRRTPDLCRALYYAGELQADGHQRNGDRHRDGGFPRAPCSGLGRGGVRARSHRVLPHRRLFFGSSAAGRSLCRVSRLRVPRAVALGGKPGRVRIVHRSFHVCCGPSVCGRAWPRTRVGDEARMAQAVIARSRQSIVIRASTTVMLSYGYWQRRFGGDRSVFPLDSLRFAPLRGAKEEPSEHKTDVRRSGQLQALDCGALSYPLSLHSAEKCTRACRSGPVSFDVCLKAGDHGHPKAARPANPQSFEIRNEKERNMTTETNGAGWTTAAVLVGRLIFAALFIMAVSFKLMDINATATAIATAGFPAPHVLAWVAAVFELALIVCFLTGAYFSEAALLAAAYVVFLAFGFHGPSHWAANQAEFGSFIDHFTFAAGLLFAAAHGPGRVLAMKREWLMR